MSAKPSKSATLVLTIHGDGHFPPAGYAILGVHSLDAAKAAADAHDGGADGGWPRHTVIEVLPGSLSCFHCGKAWNRKHERHCLGDEDSMVWSWGHGDTYTVIMRDGRSIFDHYPEIAKRVQP